MRLNAKQIAAYTGGQFLVDPIDPSALLTGITWDSREVQPGWLYVALPGERVDGHDFIEAALRAGALAALVSDAVPRNAQLLAREMGAALIEVPHTANAITDLAREWRGHLKGRVVGLTGSVGKTTTKNLLRDVCAAYGSVVATKANQNNELGVPRTLLNANPETDVVVVEMGMRGRGQIASLCDFVRPTWGLITNVGQSHIELLGSQENIARAKAELLEAIPAGTGRAFVNAADTFARFVVDQSQLTKRSVMLSCFTGGSTPASECFTQDGNQLCEQVVSGNALPSEVSVVQLLSAFNTCDTSVWAEDITLDAEGRPCFMLCAARRTSDRDIDKNSDDFQGEGAWIVRQPCTLTLTGVHNVGNACAAASVGLALGLSLDTIARALASSLPEPGRQEIVEARAGFTVINDAYNASPDSMRASLATFSALNVAGRRVAVLGDMGELGPFAQSCHEGIGRYAASLPIDYLICVGDLAQGIADAAEGAGMNPSCVIRVHTVADVLEELDTYLEPKDVVLVKASHFMGLDRVVEGLVN